MRVGSPVESLRHGPGPPILQSRDPCSGTYTAYYAVCCAILFKPTGAASRPASLLASISSDDVIRAAHEVIDMPVSLPVLAAAVASSTYRCCARSEHAAGIVPHAEPSVSSVTPSLQLAGSFAENASTRGPHGGGLTSPVLPNPRLARADREWRAHGRCSLRRKGTLELTAHNTLLAQTRSGLNCTMTSHTRLSAGPWS